MKIKNKKYSWWPPASRLIKNGKVMCPRCEKHLAILDERLGVLPCKFCNAKSVNYKSSSPLSYNQKIKNLSPEEVLSGVQYGLPKTYTGESKDYREEQAEQTKAVKEAL